MATKADATRTEAASEDFPGALAGTLLGVLAEGELEAEGIEDGVSELGALIGSSNTKLIK